MSKLSLPFDKQNGGMYGSYLRIYLCQHAGPERGSAVIALQEMAVPEGNVYMDKQSAKDFQRPQYRKLVRHLRRDDYSISRAFTV